jgi:hypothetical protein
MLSSKSYRVHFNISVWHGIIGDIVLGSYKLPDRLTAQQYCDFLEIVLPELLEGVSLAVRQRLWFQHDRAPGHYREDAQQWLNATHPGKWTV